MNFKNYFFLTTLILAIELRASQLTDSDREIAVWWDFDEYKNPSTLKLPNGKDQVHRFNLIQHDGLFFPDFIEFTPESHLGSLFINDTKSINYKPFTITLEQSPDESILVSAGRYIYPYTYHKEIKRKFFRIVPRINDIPKTTLPNAIPSIPAQSPVPTLPLPTPPHTAAPVTVYQPSLQTQLQSNPLPDYTPIPFQSIQSSDQQNLNEIDNTSMDYAVTCDYVRFLEETVTHLQKSHQQPKQLENKLATPTKEVENTGSITPVLEKRLTSAENAIKNNKEECPPKKTTVSVFPASNLKSILSQGTKTPTSPKSVTFLLPDEQQQKNQATVENKIEITSSFSLAQIPPSKQTDQIIEPKNQTQTRESSSLAAQTAPILTDQSNQKTEPQTPTLSFIQIPTSNQIDLITHENDQNSTAVNCKEKENSLNSSSPVDSGLGKETVTNEDTTTPLTSLTPIPPSNQTDQTIELENNTETIISVTSYPIVNPQTTSKKKNRAIRNFSTHFQVPLSVRMLKRNVVKNNETDNPQITTSAPTLPETDLTVQQTVSVVSTDFYDKKNEDITPLASLSPIPASNQTDQTIELENNTETIISVTSYPIVNPQTTSKKKNRAIRNFSTHFQVPLSVRMLKRNVVKNNETDNPQITTSAPTLPLTLQQTVSVPLTDFYDKKNEDVTDLASLSPISDSTQTPLINESENNTKTTEPSTLAAQTPSILTDQFNQTTEPQTPTLSFIEMPTCNQIDLITHKNDQNNTVVDCKEKENGLDSFSVIDPGLSKETVTNESNENDQQQLSANQSTQEEKEKEKKEEKEKVLLTQKEKKEQRKKEEQQRQKQREMKAQKEAEKWAKKKKKKEAEAKCKEEQEKEERKKREEEEKKQAKLQKEQLEKEAAEKKAVEIAMAQEQKKAQQEARKKAEEIKQLQDQTLDKYEQYAQTGNFESLTENPYVPEERLIKLKAKALANLIQKSQSESESLQISHDRVAFMEELRKKVQTSDEDSKKIRTASYHALAMVTNELQDFDTCYEYAISEKDTTLLIETLKRKLLFNLEGFATLTPEAYVEDAYNTCNLIEHHLNLDTFFNLGKSLLELSIAWYDDNKENFIKTCDTIQKIKATIHPSPSTDSELVKLSTLIPSNECIKIARVLNEYEQVSLTEEITPQKMRKVFEEYDQYLEDRKSQNCPLSTFLLKKLSSFLINSDSSSFIKMFLTDSKIPYSKETSPQVDQNTATDLLSISLDNSNLTSLAQTDEEKLQHTDCQANFSNKSEKEIEAEYVALAFNAATEKELLDCCNYAITNKKGSLLLICAKKLTESTILYFTEVKHTNFYFDNLLTIYTHLTQMPDYEELKKDPYFIFVTLGIHLLTLAHKSNPTLVKEPFSFEDFLIIENEIIKIKDNIEKDFSTNHELIGLIKIIPTPFCTYWAHIINGYTKCKLKPEENEKLNETMIRMFKEGITSLTTMIPESDIQCALSKVVVERMNDALQQGPEFLKKYFIIDPELPNS